MGVSSTVGAVPLPSPTVSTPAAPPLSELSMSHPLVHATGVEVRRLPGTIPGFVRFEAYDDTGLLNFTEIRADRVAPDLEEWFHAYYRQTPSVAPLRLIAR